MNTGTQLVQAAMPELRSRYASRLRNQSAELLDFISRCERGKLTEQACDDARLLAHNLCGSGTTFGFPEISDAARYLENAIDCGAAGDPQSYIELALRLIRACDPVLGNAANANEAEADGSAELGEECVEQPLLLAFSDDESAVAVLQQMFGARMEIVGTHDETEALDLMAFGKPATLIFDFGPQQISASFEKLFAAASKQNIPVIALTATRQAAAIVHAISDGAVQCVMKPISVEKLFHAAHSTIERGRLVALIGDDDVIVRELITHRFKAYGFTVVGANDGAQVLDLAARHHPSIIVLDRIMPGIEGLTILRMLKANPATHAIPVIMLSAKRKANEITDARRAGAADYIVKPFKPDQVVLRCLSELGVSSRPPAARGVVHLSSARRPRRAVTRVQ